MAEFKVISWSPLDPITDEKLDAMVSNDNYLRENMVTGLYSGNGVSRATGVRIASGLVQITASKSNQQTRSVSFGNFFSQACKPIVTTGVMSNSHRQVYATFDGPGGAISPTRDGFRVTVNVDAASKNKKIKRNFYVSWHAIGF